MAGAAGYECLATAYQYRQLPVVAHRFLAERGPEPPAAKGRRLDVPGASKSLFRPAQIAPE
ncbi:MAG: hypothetical protein JWP08_4512 [Bryobacterales bacterium]|nr:hypothetical protein [Bryobacterales bacterium]